MSIIGTTSEAPPPVAAALQPKTGPIERLAKRGRARTPMRASPCTRPMDVVVLPSPAGVGVMAETSTSLPRRGRSLNAFSDSLAL